MLLLCVSFLLRSHQSLIGPHSHGHMTTELGNKDALVRRSARGALVGAPARVLHSQVILLATQAHAVC